MDVMFDWSDYEKGKRLREFRERADYTPEIDDLDDMVTGAFDHADAILHWLDKI